MNVKKILSIASVACATLACFGTVKTPKEVIDRVCSVYQIQNKMTGAERMAYYQKMIEKDLPTQKDLGEPRLSARGASTVILFGDTQTYTPRMQYQPIMELMTTWVAVNIEKLNIKGLLHTGDVVEQNNVARAYWGANQNSKQQWEWASHCFERLDDKIPTIFSTGNHDYGHYSFDGQKSKGTSQLTKYFDVSRNEKTMHSIVEIYKEPHKPELLDNVLYRLSLGGKWGDIYILSLEFAPRKEVLAWACELMKKYSERCVILLTHRYLSFGDIVLPEAENIWFDFIKKSPAIKFVVCGHYSPTYTDFKSSVAFRQDTNAIGKKVYSMMFDPQSIGGGWSGNGGDGWLRILEFQPDGKTIKVSTYSTLFGVSPTTKHLAWRTAPYDMFEFTLDK